MSTTTQPISEVELATKWLDFTVTSFIENMRKLRIVDTGALLASFKKQVSVSAKGRLQLSLGYALYGQFVDMGVGRGMKAGVRKGDDGYDRVRNTRGKLRRHERKARPWYSKEMAYQTKRLSELMLDLYGQVLITTATDVPGNATINF